LSDEVYRPIFHGINPTSSDFPPSILYFGYENTIAVGSMSKGYSLAGIRTGWLASRNKAIIAKIHDARHYTTISVSQLDSAVAAYALSPHTIHALIGRNLRLAKTNLDILEKWIDQNKELCEWVKPVAGTTAFVKFNKGGQPVDAEELCRKLIEETGVLWVPGSHAFGAEFAGYVRIGYVCETQTLIEGLEKAGHWLANRYSR
jgi:aspartate/methionine/tyrosine aminotransferase